MNEKKKHFFLFNIWYCIKWLLLNNRLTIYNDYVWTNNSVYILIYIYILSHIYDDDVESYTESVIYILHLEYCSYI